MISTVKFHILWSSTPNSVQPVRMKADKPAFNQDSETLDLNKVQQKQDVKVNSVSNQFLVHQNLCHVYHAVDVVHKHMSGYEKKARVMAPNSRTIRNIF